ncbi:MAG: hypothetical protein KC636_34525 [Myxococcales bacterium]|nr:hypothetical protein [Myxococcales bacterium]
MTRRRAIALLAGILAVAAIEWFAAARAYRSKISDDDWAALAEVVAALPADEPVLLATPWLGPRARMELPALASWTSAAPPDLHGVARFHVLGLGDAWHEALDGELDGLPAPTHLGETRAGPLALHHYAQAATGQVLEDMVDAGARLQVQDQRGRCSGRGPWRCKGGALAVEALEIDYRPRRCLAARLDDGGRVTVRLRDARLGAELRGHLGFSDFNARLRSDAPVALAITIDGALAGRFVFTDSQGWAGFRVATTPGVHDVEVELVTTVSGTWQGVRYQGRREHVPCFELRALAEAGA